MMHRTTRPSTSQRFPVTSTPSSSSNRIIKPAANGRIITTVEKKTTKTAHPAVKNVSKSAVPKPKPEAQSKSNALPEPAPMQVESRDKTDVVNAICKTCGKKYYFDENVEGVCGDGDVHIPKVGSVDRDGMLKVPKEPMKPGKQRIRKTKKEKEEEAVVDMVKNFKASCSTCGKKYFIVKNDAGVCGKGSHIQAWGSRTR